MCWFLSLQNIVYNETNVLFFQEAVKSFHSHWCKHVFFFFSASNRLIGRLKVVYVKLELSLKNLYILLEENGLLPSGLHRFPGFRLYPSVRLPSWIKHSPVQLHLRSDTEQKAKRCFPAPPLTAVPDKTFQTRVLSETQRTGLKLWNLLGDVEHWVYRLDLLIKHWPAA